MPLARVWLACALLSGAGTQLIAATECDAVLKKDLRVVQAKSSSRDQATRNFMCSHDFNEFNDTYGGSASGHYGAAGGSGEYNQGNYKKFQIDHCSDAEASEHQNGFEYYALMDASAANAHDWKECMANLAGIHCWAEPENQDIAIVLSMKDPELTQIVGAILSKGASLISEKEAIAKGRILKFGRSTIVVERASQKIPVSLTINVESATRANTCRVTVPAMAAIEPAIPPAIPKVTAPIEEFIRPWLGAALCIDAIFGFKSGLVTRLTKVGDDQGHPVLLMDRYDLALPSSLLSKQEPRRYIVSRLDQGMFGLVSEHEAAVVKQQGTALTWWQAREWRDNMPPEELTAAEVANALTGPAARLRVCPNWVPKKPTPTNQTTYPVFFFEILGRLKSGEQFSGYGLAKTADGQDTVALTDGQPIVLDRP